MTSNLELTVARDPCGRTGEDRTLDPSAGPVLGFMIVGTGGVA